MRSDMDHSFTCKLHHACLYSPAAEHHRPLAGTHFTFPRKVVGWFDLYRHIPPTHVPYTAPSVREETSYLWRWWGESRRRTWWAVLVAVARTVLRRRRSCVCRDTGPQTASFDRHLSVNNDNAKGIKLYSRTSQSFIPYRKWLTLQQSITRSMQKLKELDGAR